ncbi:MAG: NTP transferase domain-containing protein [Elusimicrobiota bacterium]
MLSFVILAAGKGVRMDSSIPKPLHKIGGKSMLERVVENARKLDTDKIVVVVSDEKVAEKAKELGSIPVWQKIPIGTADALKLALYECYPAGELLLSCSDIPLVTAEIFQGLYSKHIQTGNYMTVLTTEVEDPHGYGRVIKKGQAVISIVEEKEASDKERKIKLINSGIYCIKRIDLKNKLGRIKRSAVKGEYYLTNLVSIAAADNLGVGEFRCDNRYVMGINTKEQLEKAEQLWSKRCIAN